MWYYDQRGFTCRIRLMARIPASQAGDRSPILLCDTGTLNINRTTQVKSGPLE
jgi:hypothetical protein